MVRNYTDAELLARVKKTPRFISIPQEYWIIGARSNEDTPNRPDDKFYLFLGEKFIDVMRGTTNPGTSTLTQFEKVNKAGAAILKADQWYNKFWHYGKHNKKVEALLQIGSPADVYRDTDKDLKSEQIGVLQTGYFGINFHPNTYDLSKPSGDTIGWWSAGCQVAFDVKKYKQWMQYVKPQKVVSYCLINEF